MWSQAELAAERALESFLALMIAAPRCWTVVMNSPLSLIKRRVTHQFLSASKIETDINILVTLAFVFTMHHQQQAHEQASLHWKSSLWHG